MTDDHKIATECEECGYEGLFDVVWANTDRTRNGYLIRIAECECPNCGALTEVIEGVVSYD